MSRFFNSYYIANYAVLLLYPLFRVLSGIEPSRLFMSDDTLPGSLAYSREVQVLATCTVIAFLKYIKSLTWEAFFAEFFFYYKISIIILCFFISIWLMCWYIFACLLVWMLFKMPMYDGPNKFKEIDSMRDFEEDVLKSKKTWIVLFYAPWNDDCLTTMTLWSDLSIKYTTNSLCFAKIDVENNEHLAKKCAVDNSGFSRQLPSLIVYEDGKEVKRFPPVDKEGYAPKVRSHKTKEIVQFLGIDRRYLATRDN